MSVIGDKADIKSEQGLIAAVHQQVFWNRARQRGTLTGGST
jgi:hypothetical protein